MALSLKRYTWSYYKKLDGILKERSRKEREMSVGTIAMRSDLFLPESMVIEILSWLPVKNLLQFKCVCKSWYAIITSPHFISKHLKNYYHNSAESDCLLAIYCVPQAVELESFELLIEETPTPRVLAYESLDSLPIRNPFIYGPCDGIFYTYSYCHKFRALWNPAMNELKTLPPIPNPPPSFSYRAGYETYGFGLHPVTKDYQVVVMKHCWPEKEEERGESYPLCVLVYSFSTDSWRYVGDTSPFHDLQNHRCYVCLNGVSYWLGSYELCGKPEGIVSFDMATDTCREIQLPDYDMSFTFEHLAMFHDSIALLAFQHQEQFLHMWTMNERCWTKKFAMGPLPEVRYPVGYWQKNKLILMSNSRELILCDPSTQEISNLGFKSCDRFEGIFVYKESLVLVNNGNGSQVSRSLRPNSWWIDQITMNQ